MRRYVGRWQLFSLVYLFVFTIIFLVIQPCEAAKNPGRIQGVVRDSDGDPVIGAEVTLTPTGRNPDVARTNKKGKYGFKNLELGTYDVSLSEDCYANGAQQLQQVELTPEAPVGTADFNLTELTNQGMLAGMVKDRVTKKPLANTTVRISIDSVSGETTDNRGIFRFEQCLTSGTRYTVEAEKDGYNTEQKRITAGEGENKLLFKLTPVSTTTSSTTTTSAGTTTTTLASTTTTSVTTTTTVPVTGCGPCAGAVHGITFSKTCNSFTFAISGESGSRTENLFFKKDGRGRIANVCGTVTYASSGNTYCVEINVTWGPFCISSINGIAKWIGIGATTTTFPTTTTTTTTPGATTTTTTGRTTTTTIVADFIGRWDIPRVPAECVVSGNCTCNAAFGPVCYQALANGNLLSGDGTVIGRWVKTGPTTVRIDSDKTLLESEFESQCKETGCPCDVTILTANALITLNNNNQISGTASLTMSIFFFCTGDRCDFTLTARFTGRRTTVCPTISTLGDSSNQMWHIQY